ncbi:MAG: methylcrotonoyl-CoA carboxylase, partial [Pseudomonadota bacterium]|nr:methylcrotonoyl-CoA carboxylase [Pseudomonadota bacterium]
AVGYEGAGTVEFIADASEGLRADRIFFMEMNTRLQVEHPVTEMITGQDLVEWQLRVASGEPLPLSQEALAISGHAMEARLYAENPSTGFLPSTGRLEHFVLPAPVGAAIPVGGQPVGGSSGDGPTLRIDSAVEEGGEVSVFYDPMIAKLISHGATRQAAAQALADACREVEVWPVRTNAAFLARCLQHPDFLAGEVDTSFIPARQDQLTAPAKPSEAALDEAVRQQVERLVTQGDHEQPHSPWNSFDGLGGFRLNAPARAVLRLQLGEEVLERPLDPELDPFVGYGAPAAEGDIVVFEDGEVFAFSEPDYEQAHGGAESDGVVIAPMPGRIVSVEAEPGAHVSKGAKLVILEAMKMEHGLTAPFDGVVAEVSATAGVQVSEGTVLVRLQAAE